MLIFLGKKNLTSYLERRRPRFWIRYFCNKILPPQPRFCNHRRVVVTGLGTVNPLGHDVHSSWSELLSGKSAVEIVPEFVESDLPVRIGARASRGRGRWKLDNFLVNKSVESVDFIAFAMAAATEALTDAKWFPKTASEKNRTGITLGAGVGSLEEIQKATTILNNEHGVRRLSPYFLTRTLINLAAGSVSIKFGLRGPNHSCTTACATGAHSIGDAFRFICFGDADVMVAGGTESSINKLSVAGFSRIKALTSAYNNNPKIASRPFDSDRTGFVLGEGAGVLVLEEYEHARNRGAKIYAEVRGYGLSGDSHHVTAPCADGDGAYRAMESALRQAGLLPNHIDYVNAHATSTPIGDIVECIALRRLFYQGASLSGEGVAISSTKGATGHLLGAAGAVEAIFSILAIHNNILPATVNLFSIDEKAKDLNIIPHGPCVEKDCKVVMTNSFGFGGTNCSLIFAEME